MKIKTTTIYELTQYTNHEETNDRLILNRALFFKKSSAKKRANTLEKVEKGSKVKFKRAGGKAFPQQWNAVGKYKWEIREKQIFGKPKKK